MLRGGEAKAGDLVKGYKKHTGVTYQDLYGLSVQYAPGAGLLPDQLACVGGGVFLNPKYSYATNIELLQAGTASGHTVGLVKSPGRGNHFTLTAVGEQKLPDDLAQALGAAWDIRPKRVNPCPL